MIYRRDVRKLWEALSGVYLSGSGLDAFYRSPAIERLIQFTRSELVASWPAGINKDDSPNLEGWAVATKAFVGTRIRPSRRLADTDLHRRVSEILKENHDVI